MKDDDDYETGFFTSEGSDSQRGQQRKMKEPEIVKNIKIK